MFYVYYLESVNNGKFYVGRTNDLKRRYEEHNSGHGGDFTAKNGPWKLIFYEAFINGKDAIVAEEFFKSGYGREVLKDKLKNYLRNKHYSGIV
ncbi:MAG: GIY-YIG nuclease family protein [Patescibacteria group bacterium]